jgi:hypothetical protein
MPKAAKQERDAVVGFVSMTAADAIQMRDWRIAELEKALGAMYLAMTNLQANTWGQLGPEVDNARRMARAALRGKS